VRSTTTCARFDPLLTYSSWTDLGIRLARYANGTAWWLGDWMVFGRHKYGRRYRDALAATGLDYQTLRNYAVVARRFEPSRRREDLSFHHHAEVCKLDDQTQDYWLDVASAHRWSRNELRRRIRAGGEAEMPDRAFVRVGSSPESIERWRRAAESSTVGFGEWIERTLDAAAAAVLTEAMSWSASSCRVASTRLVP